MTHTPARPEGDHAPDKLPTRAEQMAEYDRRKAVYDEAMRLWRESGEDGPMPPRPVRPHTPGFFIPEKNA